MYDTRAQERDEARLLPGLEASLRPYRRATILGYAWWWRYEIGIMLGLSIGMYMLIRLAGPDQTVMGVALTAALLGPWPATHRAVTASAWVIITPHRLRGGFIQARIHAQNGRLPTILRTTQQPFGERVLVWCQAGTSAADFQAAHGILAAACWAAAIKVTSDEWHTHLVTLDVIRQHPSPVTQPA